ncbi:sensor histidine kinase [bacterium]|nr:sensor histidine kinase [bacterium]
MISIDIIATLAAVYVVFLFSIAFVADRRVRAGRPGILRSPVVYTLSLSVYCTAWTFYGAVGSAARNGLEFLAIYLGPTLIFVGWWWFLRRLVRVGRAQRVTSIADLISARYGKSNSLAILVTLIAIIGTTPYIALQLQSLTLSFSVFSIDQSPHITADFSGGLEGSWNQATALIIALGLAAFTIIFGTRNLNASERHDGVVAAIAVEAIVKLIALVTVGIAVCYWIWQSPEPLFSPNMAALLAKSQPINARWLTLIALSAFAIISLPRMFQVIVVENRDDRQLAMASWAFPAYLLLLCLFVLPIALFGLANMPAGANPDLFLLTVPLSQNQNLLAALAFLGGFSSATSMVIVAALALSTMVSNHIILPLWLSLHKHGVSANGDLRVLTLVSRRVSILVILMLGFLYFQFSGGSEALAAIGLIAFLGVSQVVPALVGGIFWSNATKRGAVVGVVIGATVWVYTSFLPSFDGHLLLSPDIMTSGLFGAEWLRPNALFGSTISDPLVHAFVWSMGLNSFFFVLVSLLTRPSEMEQFQALAFSSVLPGRSLQLGINDEISAEALLALSQRILGYKGATQLFNTAAKNQGNGDKTPSPTPEFIEILEREFASVVGAATAHTMTAQLLGTRHIPVSDLVALASESAEVRAYSSQLEAKSNELEKTATQLRKANMQLVQLGQQRDSFLSQVSHELRTPMTSIRSFSEILQSPQSLDPERHAHFASVIHDESLRLTGLLDEILEVSFLENGRVVMKSEEAVLSTIIDRALMAVDSLITERKALIYRDRKAETITLHTDADRLCQALINLLSNAVKHNSKRTPKVWIRCVRLTGDDAGNKAGDEAENGLSVSIQIEDNGPGVAPAQQDSIFEKFATVTPTNSKEGVGLGLPISQQIITNLGGKLDLLASPSGALFEIRLP